MYKEKIVKLMTAVKDQPDDLEFVESRMNTFTEYVGHVAWMETRIQRLNIEGIRGQEYRDQVQQLDYQRRSKHEVAMGAINQLNRLSKVVGLEPFYDGPVDNEHRDEIGDVIGNIVNEYFEGRTVGRLKHKDLVGEAEICSFADAVASIPESSENLGR